MVLPVTPLWTIAMIINTDWFGASCPKVSFDLTSQNKHIIFTATLPPTLTQPIGIAGQYTEGLWEHDVAELFINNPNTGKYIEINIAPNGAWWLMLFTAPRQRDPHFVTDTFTLTPKVQQSKQGGQISLTIPHKLLHSLLGSTNYHYNVCFILGESPRQYMSLNQLNSKQPDFHRPDEFATIVSL